MSSRSDSSRNGWTRAACAVAMAASLGAAGSAGEAQAVEQIGRYCTVSWRNAGIPSQEWPDCTQQTFELILERLSRGKLTEAIAEADSRERRELNRSIWCVVQRWRRRPRQRPLQVDRCADPSSLPEPPGRTEDTPAGEEIARALERLTPRQRRIISKWMHGASISRIAAELGLSPERTSDEKYKALRKLRRYFDGRSA